MPSPLCTLIFYCCQGLLLNEAVCQEYVCVNCFFSSLVSFLPDVSPDDLCEGKRLRSVAPKGVVCLVIACAAGALLGYPCWPSSVGSPGCMPHWCSSDGALEQDLWLGISQSLFLQPGSRHSHSSERCSVRRLKWKTNLCYFSSLW